MNRFGRIFQVSIFGESHGSSVGILIDGCPPGVEIDNADLTKNLSRRRSGARGTTARQEKDQPSIESGVYQGKTTGTPMLIRFENRDTVSGDYLEIKKKPRPGHADFTGYRKYRGFGDPRGGGHFSGRLTTGLVAAGSIARKIIAPAKVKATLLEAGGTCNIPMAVERAVEAKDSIGGIIECRVSGVAAGLGEPFFDSVESLISHGIFSVPGVRGIEFGAGFRAAEMTGSKHNDPILDLRGTTVTNNAGGVNGGISNGNDIVFRVCIKPTSTTGIPQQTVSLETGDPAVLNPAGRHDTCFALRCPVIVESVTAIVLADLSLFEM